MKMNKYLISAFGALSLIAFNACSTEDLAEPSVSIGSESASEPAEMAGEVIVKFDAAVSDMLDERGLAQTRSGAPPHAAESTPWTKSSTCSANASWNAFSR